MAKKKSTPKNIQRPASRGRTGSAPARSLKLPVGSGRQPKRQTSGKPRQPKVTQKGRAGAGAKGKGSRDVREWHNLIQQAAATRPAGRKGTSMTAKDWYKLIQDAERNAAKPKKAPRSRRVSPKTTAKQKAGVSKGKKKAAKKEPIKKKQRARSVKSGAIKIGNRTLSPEISAVLRELRAKYLDAGKMVTYNWLYRQYNKYAKLSCEPGEFSGYKDPLDGYIDELADQHSYTVFARLNTCKDEVINLKDEAIGRGTIIKLYVKGYFEDKAMYYQFNEGLEKMDDELDITWKAIAEYKRRHNPPSPLFSIPVCINRLTYVVVVDFNDILVENMDKGLFMNIVRELK